MDTKHLIASFLPFLTNQNWYASAYLIFYPLSIYANKLLQNLERKEHFNLCIILIIISAGLSSIPLQKAFDPDYLIYFFTFYFIANYIKKYNPSCFNNFRKNLIISICLISFFVLWANGIYYVSKCIKFVSNYYNFFVSLIINDLLKVITAIYIFCTFRELKLKQNKIINLIGGCTFGIYLIHNNRTFKHYMWFELFNTQSYIESLYLPLYCLSCVVILLVIGTLIELVRQKFFVLLKVIINKLFLEKNINKFNNS